MPAEPTSLADYRRRRALRSNACERLPLAMNVHVGAVELILGSPLDDGPELWLSGEQAIELGHELVRLGQVAKGRV